MAGASSGCSESAPFEFVPIRGKITYTDGTPIAADVVHAHFMPQGEPVGDFYPQPAQARLKADGTFDGASTRGPKDGAIPGRQKVVIEAANGNFSPNEIAVAARYCNLKQTPLEVEVKRDRVNDFELKVERGP